MDRLLKLLGARMKALFNRLFSRREAATVPSMDGVLRPNALLDTAVPLVSIEEPDNLVPMGGGLIFSSGSGILRLPSPRGGGAAVLVRDCAAPVTALAASPDGGLAAGLAGAGISVIGGAHDGVLLSDIGPRPIRGPTALVFADENTLFAAIGSAHNEPGEWQRDLMERRASGSIWKIGLQSRTAVCIADGLAFPNGLLVERGTLIVSESWNHRLLRLKPAEPRARPQIVLEDLPGYPGRLSPGSGGGAWLSVFAPRSQLIEFVLRERAYCARMLREVPRELWIAPSLRAGLSFREPMQGGAVRVHGIYKPWAPTRSYGLAVQLDADLMPLRSFHSRADGRSHGVVSVCEYGGDMVFASRGDNFVGALSLMKDALTETAG